MSLEIASVASGPAVQILFRSLFAPLTHSSDTGDGLAAAATAAATVTTAATAIATTTACDPVLFEDKVQYKVPTDPTVPQRSSGAGAFPFHQDFAFWSTYSTSLATFLICMCRQTLLRTHLHAFDGVMGWVLAGGRWIGISTPKGPAPMWADLLCTRRSIVPRPSRRRPPPGSMTPRAHRPTLICWHVVQT